MSMDGFEEFCEGVWPDLYRGLVTVTGDPAQAEDIAQEALARVLVRWGRVQGMVNPEGYAYRIALNLAKKAHGRTVMPFATTRQPFVESESDDIVSRLTMAEALSALPFRQRSAVVLRYGLDLSVEETAARMGCRAGTVKALCSQARQRIRTSDDLHALLTARQGTIS